jgi:hypothetical protein
VGGESDDYMKYNSLILAAMCANRSTNQFTYTSLCTITVNVHCPRIQWLNTLNTLIKQNVSRLLLHPLLSNKEPQYTPVEHCQLRNQHIWMCLWVTQGNNRMHCRGFTHRKSVVHNFVSKPNNPSECWTEEWRQELNTGCCNFGHYDFWSSWEERWNKGWKTF